MAAPKAKVRLAAVLWDVPRGPGPCWGSSLSHELGPPGCLTGQREAARPRPASCPAAPLFALGCLLFPSKWWLSHCGEARISARGPRAVAVKPLSDSAWGGNSWGHNLGRGRGGAPPLGTVPIFQSQGPSFRGGVGVLELLSPGTEVRAGAGVQVREAERLSAVGGRRGSSAPGLPAEPCPPPPAHRLLSTHSPSRHRDPRRPLAHPPRRGPPVSPGLHHPRPAGPLHPQFRDLLKQLCPPCASFQLSVCLSVCL